MTDEVTHDPELQAELDEALLALEELITESPEEALSMYESLPAEVRNRFEFRLSKARALRATEQLDDARHICETLIAETDDRVLQADIHHLLGDLLEDLGDTDAANEHFISVLRIDQEMFPTLQHVAEPQLSNKLNSLTKSAIQALSSAAQAQITGHSVVLFPSEDEVRSGLDPRAFSVYVPNARGGEFKVFAANLDAEFGDLEELDEFDEHVITEIKEQLAEQLGL
jgi:tetratricopeptide (TPR) repeat protein